MSQFKEFVKIVKSMPQQLHFSLFENCRLLWSLTAWS